MRISDWSSDVCSSDLAMTPEQKRKYLPKMAAGEMIFAFSMSEPGTGSDISGLSTRAERAGEDWLITGNKYWCTNADGADAILVLPRTEPVDAAKPQKATPAFHMIGRAPGRERDR